MALRRTDTCYFCRFWIGQGIRERGPKGSCRRYPPGVTGRAPEGSFPITLSTDWCGEWQRDAGQGRSAEATEREGGDEGGAAPSA